MKIWQKKYYRSYRTEKMRKRLEDIANFRTKFE